MYLNDTFDSSLSQLDKYRGKKGWRKFLCNADKLKKLDDEYNGAAHTPPVPKELEKKIASKIMKLENKKEKVQKLIKGQTQSDDYNAVESLVSSAKEGYSFLL